MDRQFQDIEHLLTTLGEAHRDGAFSTVAAQHPWKAAKGQASTPARHRHSWFWVGAPLAAAAAVVVLFVGPSLFPGRATPKFAMNTQTTLLPQHPEVLAEVSATTASTPANCDYNGDGVVDGKDIQALVERVKNTDSDPTVEAAQLQRCLLGS